MSDAQGIGRMLADGLADTTPHPLGREVVGAQGARLQFADGGSAIDMISGIGVSAFGHGHPEIKQAIHDQVERHLHVMVYGEFPQAAQRQAARNLFRLLPPALDSVYFVNSGAEAIEGALKLAKRVTGRTRTMAFDGGYHGNTAGALSVSSNASRKAPFLPLLPEVTLLPWNVSAALASIDDTVACVLLETVQGDAGVRIPSQAWMTALEARCKAVGALLILDEIQSGMGRTGKAFAFEHFQVEPDILCLGKALGGGMPIGAFVAEKSRMNQLAMSPKLGHITTFGGHPVACAASAVATDLLSRMDWSAMERQGAMMERALQAMPHVQAVRRLGYFIAVELDTAERVAALVQRALEAGVLVFFFLSVPHAFRLAPPLNLSEAEMTEALEVLAQVLAQI